MYLEDMNKAVDEAKDTLRRVDWLVGAMAKMISGRLRKGDVLPSVLSELKRELQAWDMHKKTWKGRG